MDTGIWVLIAIAVIAIDAILSTAFGRAAQDKGYESSKYWWYCFLFGLAGWILVAALPDRVQCFLPKNESGAVREATVEQLKKNPELWNLLDKFDWQYGCIYKTAAAALLSATQLHALIAAGAIEKKGDYYDLTDEGRAYLKL